MARFELQVEHDFDFGLIGIACHAPDYRMCWCLNLQLGINLERLDTPVKALHKDKTAKAAFPVFFHRDDERHHEFTLVVNRQAGDVLIPEVKEADYLLMLRGLSNTEVDRVNTMVKSENIVLTSFAINVTQLKSKEILLF